jgi:hypothetical protein
MNSDDEKSEEMEEVMEQDELVFSYTYNPLPTVLTDRTKFR